MNSVITTCGICSQYLSLRTHLWQRWVWIGDYPSIQASKKLKVCVWLRSYQRSFSSSRHRLLFYWTHQREHSFSANCLSQNESTGTSLEFIHNFGGHVVNWGNINYICFHQRGLVHNFIIKNILELGEDCSVSATIFRPLLLWPSSELQSGKYKSGSWSVLQTFCVLKHECVCPVEYYQAVRFCLEIKIKLILDHFHCNSQQYPINFEVFLVLLR